MVSIYLDGALLHGAEHDMRLTEATLSLEINRAGSLELILPPTHRRIKDIKKLKSKIAVQDEYGVIWRGRPLITSQDLSGNLQVVCEGDLARLNDSVVTPYSFQGAPADLFKKLIREHNLQTGQNFGLGDIDVTDNNNYVAYSDSTYPATWKVIDEKFIKRLGGYIFLTYPDINAEPVINYKMAVSSKSSRDVKYAVNLLSLSAEQRAEDLATSILPLGAVIRNEGEATTGAEKRITIESVNQGVAILDDPDLTAKYGRIVKTVTWDDVTLPENLLRKAREELAMLTHFANSYEVSFVDLAYLDKVKPARLMDYVLVTAPSLNLSTRYQISKMSVPLLKPATATITLGLSTKSLTERAISDIGKLSEQNKPDKWTIGSDGYWYLNGKKTEVKASGKDGKDGKSIKRFDTEYYLSSSTEAPTGGAWQATYPETKDGYSVWIRTKVTWSDDTVTYTEPVIDRSSEAALKESQNLLTKINNLTSQITALEKEFNSKDLVNKDELVEELRKLNEARDKLIEQAKTLVKDELESKIAENINLLDEKVTSSITQAGDVIRSEIGKQVYYKGEVDSLLKEQSTAFSQTKEDFQFKFNEFVADLDAVRDGTNAKFVEIQKYIRFVDGEIQVGNNNSDVTSTYTSDGMHIKVGGQTVAKFTKDFATMKNIEVENQLKFGSRWAIRPGVSGNLDDVWIG